MQFPQPLKHGVLVARYKRFFADVTRDDGETLTAHCPNPGAMLGLNTPGRGVWISRSDDPKRKLAHTLELVEADGALVCVNTMTPNRLVAEALSAGAIAELGGYQAHQREARYGAASRADFWLTGAGRPCWVEVKGVTLLRGGGLAEWPDCVSARGARHMAELAARAAVGERAVVLFVVLRADAGGVAIAGDLDPGFAAALAAATEAGVEALAYGCTVSPQGIEIARRLPFQL